MLYFRITHDLKRKNVWVYSLVDRKTDQCKMELVKERTADTLLPITYDHVKPHSTIYSDLWASYNKLRDLYEYQIVHQTIIRLTLSIQTLMHAPIK